MQAASKDLATIGSKLQLTYIYLAELGIVKQRSGDVQAALSNLDSAIASYVMQDAQQNSSTWDKTILMVVGNHGYEPTPLAQRVPDPNPDPTKSQVSLIDYINSIANNRCDIHVIPQGSLATIYCAGSQRDQVLADIRNQVLAINKNNQQCSTPQPSAPPGSTPDCIDEFLYTARDS
jgi:hypothetical protein